MGRATSAAVPIVEAEPEPESVPGTMDEAVGDAARPPHEPSRSTRTVLYYTVLHYTMLYYTTLHYTILYYTILYYNILYY